MSFQQGLSGLNVAAKVLDVIGNNVANANTVGFKQSRAEFSDAYASAVAGSGDTQVGIGSKTTAIAQQFSQGNITASSNPLDIAINGQGFFRMSTEGTISFSRNGQFKVDKDGYVVNPHEQRLTGYQADSGGVIITSTPVELRVSTGDLPPIATGTSTTSNGVVGNLNLDGRATLIPPATTFDYTDADTFNFSTSLSVYDSLGNNHTYTLFFKREAVTAVPTVDWKVFATLTSNGTVTDLSSGGTVALGTLTFDASGETLSTSTPFSQAITAAQLGNGSAALAFEVDLTAATQFGSSFGVTSLTQDGYGSGRLTGYAIDAQGIIQGRYSNGQSRDLGQIVLANFSNPQGLQPGGDSGWIETPMSGQPLVGAPNTGSLGVLQSGALEDSNIDITAELVSMITAQRVYQANAQSIKTQDSVLQTLVNIR